MERTLLSGLRTLALGAVVFGMGAAVQAAPITILNHSFEDIDPPTGIQGMASQDYGWTQDAGPVYIYSNTAYPSGMTGQDGNNSVFFDQGIYGKFHQTLTTSVDTNDEYDLTFLVGAYGSPQPAADGGGYAVRLYVGNNVVASITQSADQLSVGTMVQETLHYAPQPTDSGLFKIEVERLGVLGVQDGYVHGYVGVDDFQLNATAVPEPASVALLGLGAGALVMRRRRMA